MIRHLAGCLIPAALLIGPSGWAQAPAQVWVDAYASDSGDGSELHPFKSLAHALKTVGTGAQIHLAAGLYPGPFRPPAHTHLIGSPSSVLFVDGTATVVEPEGPLTLERLAIQGGTVGVSASSDLRLKEVQFSGQRQSAALIAVGSLLAQDCVFSASVTEIPGVVVANGASALLESCAFEGPFRRAVEARSPSSVELTHCHFHGPQTGLHLIGGKARVARSDFWGGTGPAIFGAQGELVLEQVSVKGHEYGIQAGDGAIVTASDFYSIGADRAGIALVKARGKLSQLLVVDSGSFGAVQLVGAEVSIDGFWLHRPLDYGLQSRNSRLTLKNGVVTGVRSSDGSAGNAIEVRQSQATLESILALKADGAGLLAGEGSEVSLRDFSAEQCKWAGVISETLSQVRGSGWSIRSSGVALAVPDHSELQVDYLVAADNRDGVVWAECARGAQATLSRVKADAEVARSSCIHQPGAVGGP